jgi:hypothetical protein
MMIATFQDTSCWPLQDFIPPEELAKLRSKAGDKAAAEAIESKTAIGGCSLSKLLLHMCPFFLRWYTEFVLT